MPETNGSAPPTMWAVRVHSREGTRAMRLEEAPVPSIGPGEVLVRVHAAAITPTEFTWNSTFTRADGTERLPVIPSFEFSGTVASMDPSVADFTVGEAVYGLLNFWRDGAAAEYVAADGADLALKPASVDHIRAASIPLSGLTAWQGLFDHGRVKPGDRVLIHGAGGGVGSLAVQLAHWRGAYVIGTASAERAPFLHDLGIDEIVDYTRVPFEERIRDVDVVLDTVGGATLERSWPLVRRGGVLVSIAGDVPEERATAQGIRGISMLVKPDRAELIELARLVDTGVLRPVVDAVYPLSSAREAYERGAAGHNRGKTVLRVLDSATPASPRGGSELGRGMGTPGDLRE
jgi:NADPH:quinone reductase-like Zn-dependent oxidoreductase